jgi:hypothetical protein
MFTIEHSHIYKHPADQSLVPVYKVSRETLLVVPRMEV